MKTAKVIIKVMTVDQVTEAVALAWQVYQDETKRTTPPLYSEEEMAKGFLGIAKDESDFLVGYYEAEQLLGVMGLTIEHENKYCAIKGPYIENADRYMEIAGAFMTFVDEQCKGYKCHGGTTKPNANSQKFFESRGFVCTEDTIQTRIYPNTLKEVTGPYTVETLTVENYDLYRAFHTHYFSDYYWTADKIYSVMDKWNVSIVKMDGEIVGNTFTMKQSPTGGEVYGAMVLPQYEGTNMLAQLYYTSTSAIFARGVKEIVNFIPEGYQLEAAKRVGYEVYDTYMCYEHKSL